MHRSIILASTAAAVQASNLFVSSYSGTVTSLEVQEGQLSVLSSTDGCGPSPSWLMLDKPNRLLYCVDENIADGGNGSVNTFSIGDGQALTQTGRESTTPGPVSSVLYGESNSALAVASYGTPGAISALAANATSVGDLISFIDYGDDAHVHEVVLDPTGKFILAPDLGKDLVRVYTFDGSDALTEQPDYEISFDAGTGPRHAAFADLGSPYLYVVAELTNKLFTFAVHYDGDKVSFEKLAETNTFGGGQIPTGAAAAEIAVSPDNKFLLVSNRGDMSVDGNDSIATFKIGQDASLEFQELASTGGSFPRQFSINAAGTQVAVGLQKSSKVNILERNVDTGKISGIMGSIDIAGEVTCVVWDE